MPPTDIRLPWRARLRGALVLFGGRLLPRGIKQGIKKIWDPWAAPQRLFKRSRKIPRLRVGTPDKFDVICFSIIDWDFRWQRPQQLLSQFAEAGHRVFVFRITGFLPVHGGPPFEVRNVRENVWEVTLAPPEPFDVYAGTIDLSTLAWFPSMLDQLRRTMNIVSGVSLVQVATWRAVANDARQRYGWPVVYDCMDEWNSFPGMKAPLLAEEERLVTDADLVTVSAQRLFEKWRGRNERVLLVRNAADFARFSAGPHEELLRDVRRPVIGYFGAVAAWFDVELLAHVAAARPQYTFVIVGGVFDVDTRALAALPNVEMHGQQPYERMPSYLHAFDVCIIPFVVNEITAATDPVKFYEYISQGKPVVSTDMPELEPFRELLYLAHDRDEFLQQLDRAVAERNDALRARRIEAARANTWSARASVMLQAIADVHPRVSVIVISYNNIELTRACIESVLHNSVHPNLELIVIDNASSDGSAEWLQQFAERSPVILSREDGEEPPAYGAPLVHREGILRPSSAAGAAPAAQDDSAGTRVRVFLNGENLGFAGANNQGLRAATGDYLVLLNNDTVVPPGWLPRMLRHLDDREIGLTVAVTNFSGNESRIPVPYETMDDMHRFAEHYMAKHDGQRFDIHVAAMYCVGMRRDVYEQVGELDEEYGIGMFEDDDYSHRVRLAGLRVVCMEDVFVHHVGQASFSKLSPETYEQLWQRNQQHFETKWKMRWQPHRSR